MKLPLAIGGGVAAVAVVAAGLYLGLSGAGGPDAGTRAELALASMKDSGAVYSYKAAENSGRGVVLRNVSVKSPPAAPSAFAITIAELRVKDMDWANAKSPNFADVEYRGLRFEGSGGQPLPLQEMRDAIGVGDVVVNVRAAYVLDPAGRTLEIKSGDIELEGFGTLSIAAKLDGVDKEKLSGLNSVQPDPARLMGAIASLRLVSLRLAFKDAGGTSRVLDAAARKQRLATGTAVRDMALQQIEQQKKTAPFKIAREALNAAERFLKSPGTFEITANPRQPFALMSASAIFMGGPNPAAIDKLADELGLKIAAK
jgi:hypothetical protein